MSRHGVSEHSIFLATTGTLAIAAGLAIYALLRPTRIALIPATLFFPPSRHIPSLLGSLPSLLHAFAIPLLTMACVRAVRRAHVMTICLVWALIDVLFELGQRYPTRFLPSGTFDPLDVLGVLAGASLAAALASTFARREKA